MDRPTEELMLPVSGAKAVLYQNITTGDERRIRRATFAGLKMDVSAKENQVQQISGESIVDAEEVALNCLIKEIVTKEGEVVKNIAEFVYNLDPKDGALLYDRANEVSQKSIRTAEQKKN